MVAKLIRYILTLSIAIGLASCGTIPASNQTQPELMQAGQKITAAGTVTGTLFDQPVDPSGKLYLSAWIDPDGTDFDQYIWDNFTLSSDQTITDINWVGAYDPARAGLGGPVVDFRVWIYPSIAAGMEPAVAGPPLLQEQSGGNANETPIGLINNISMYSYAYTLQTPFNALAGVKYWVHIVATQQGSSPDWSIAAGTGGNGSHYRWGSGSGGDSGYRSVPGDVAFTLLGLVPDAPSDIFLSNDTVAENQPVNTLVGSLSVSDPDPNATFTYGLTCTNPGVDDPLFNISGTDLQTSVSFDFEAQNIFDICIRVTNQGGLTLDKNFVVIVSNVNETPTSISLSNAALPENQPINTVVGMLGANDPDAGSTFTFRLGCAVTGADDGAFNILGTNLRTSAVFDYETKSTYNICLSVTDQGGAAFDQNFIVTVTNVNEPPINISLTNDKVAENQPINTLVGVLSGIDPDAGATLIFSLACAVPGIDDLSFNINGTNLQTSAVFDYETKSSHTICVRVTDQGGLTFDKSFVITVNNINEAPTSISLSNTAMDENRPVNTVVGMLSATDPDASATFTFSLTCAAAGVDDGSFNILGTDLRTSAIFDFETKSVYNICIRVTDQGGLAFDKNFVIIVNNLVENTAPTDIVLSNTTVDENQPVNTVVGVLSATDPDAGATFTFSLTCAVAGVDDGSFNILGRDLRTSAIFDYGTKSAYNICIRVTDQGGLSFDKNFVITVNDLVENAAPTDIVLSNTTVDENRPVNTVVGVLSATDPDAGATFTFSLACTVAGADDGSFNILGTNLQTSTTFDFEMKSVYNICIRVTDQGGLSFDRSFVVNVNDVDEITNTPGKVTGGGNIDLTNKKATFGFVVQFDAGNTNPSGNLTFMDHSTKLSLKASSFTLLYFSGNHARITGYATVDGESDVFFLLDVYDNGEPGNTDVFTIQIPEMNYYLTSSNISGGNIKISTP